MIRTAIIISLFLIPITVASQNILNITAHGLDKVYDRQTWADVILTVIVEDGVDVVAHYSPENSNFDTWDVGVNKRIDVTGIWLTGADAANYSYNKTAITSANVTPRPIIGEFTAADKYYDTTTDATITGRSLIGVLAGDEDGVELIGGIANFNDPNAGFDKTVGQVGMKITGYRAFNYILESVAPTIADILPLLVEARFEAADKIYDKNTSATITRRYIEGLFPQDTADIKLVGGTAQFDNWNAGEDKLVIGDSTFSITGNLNGNYEIIIIPTTRATIFPKPTDVVAVQDIKVYDQNTDSDEIPYTVPDLLPGDFGTFWQVYDDKNVGTGKTMYPFGDIVDGNNGDNYEITYILNYEGIIIPLKLIGEITAADKVYDGNTDATITSRAISGVLKGDNVFYVGGTAPFDTPWVGLDKLVTEVDLSIIGSEARNYLCNSVATTTADITPLLVPSYVTSNKPVYYSLNDMVILTAVITGGGPLMKDGPQAAAYTVFSVDGYIVSDTTDNVNITLHIDPVTNDLIATLTAPLREMAPNGIMESGTKEVLAGFMDEDFNYIVSPNPAINQVDFAANFGIVVYPNPNKGNFFIEIDDNLKDDFRLSIIDITGKEVYEKEYQNPVLKLAVECNLTAQPDGIYILKLKSGSNILYRKILKINLAPNL